MSRKGGTEGRRWVHPHGEDSMLCLPLPGSVGPGGDISALHCTNGCRKQASHLVRPLFPGVKVFLSLDGWSLAKTIESSLMRGCTASHKCAHNVYKGSFSNGMLDMLKVTSSKRIWRLISVS